MDSLIAAEAEISSFEEKRVYILCPNSVFDIGYLDFDYNVAKGQPMLPLRPNMWIFCGNDGLRENGCIFNGGDIQVDATDLFIDDDSYYRLDNVVLAGLTFIHVRRYSVWATKPGDITFVNCEFRGNRKAVAPVMLDFFADYSSNDDQDERDRELFVEFVGCFFTDNRFFGLGANTAIVVGNGPENRMRFTHCIFRNNDFVFNNTLSATNSFLVETSGALEMDRNCFFDNVVGVSTVAVYGSEAVTARNHGRNSNGRTCRFVSVFRTADQLETFNPDCLDYRRPAVCLAMEIEGIPTDAPSAAHTDLPSSSPSTSSVPLSMAPSLAPSHSPSRIPSLAPSASSIPSVFPTITDAPSSIASLEPSLSPSQLPSIFPTSVPSAPPSTQVPSTTPSAGAPSLDPSERPTAVPSLVPSSGPSRGSSLEPTPSPSRPRMRRMMRRMMMKKLNRRKRRRRRRNKKANEEGEQQRMIRRRAE